jgi:hypothetical protein
MEISGEPRTEANLQAEAWSGDSRTASVELSPDPNVPGLYVGRLDNLPPGNHSLRPAGSDVDALLAAENVGGPIETVLAVEPPASTEMSDTRSNRPLLEQIAEATGGRAIPPTALEEVVRLADLEPHVSEESTRRPLWSRWSLLWILVFCLTAEWSLRKVSGLA